MSSQRLKRLFPIALIASLAACSGGSQSPSQALPAVANATPNSIAPMATASSSPSPYSSAILSDNPVAFYALNDAKPTAYDQSGNNLNGTIGSSVTTGAAGLASSSKADQFPGMQSTAGDISVPASSALQPSAAVSLESLFRFSSAPANYTVLAAYGQRSGNATYELFFKNNQILAQFTVAGGFVDIAANVSANTTYDVVATYDGSYARLYLNGQLVTSSARTGALAYVSGYGFTMGDDASNSNPGFNGTIGGVAVFSKALSASQVSAHYAAVTSTTTPAPTATPQPTAAPTATPKPTAAPTATPTTAPTASPSGSTVWQAGNASLGKWIVANTYQCGTPVNSGATFTFNLTQNGTSCGRNMANPVDGSGSVIRLADGGTYTWTFDYIDGKPDGSGPGMGSDTNASALIWQIHGYNESDSPCTGLTFVNGTKNVGGPQMWGFSTCNGLVWTGSYTPGERDTFKIVAKISETSAGYTQLYRNGVLVMTDNGANYHNSSGNPWWNFGPYKWRWELAGGGGSSMTSVNATLNNLTLTKQ